MISYDELTLFIVSISLMTATLAVVMTALVVIATRGARSRQRRH